MDSFSWRQWLRNRISSLATRAQRRTQMIGIHAVEVLESRTLLTANLPVAVDDTGLFVDPNGSINATSVLLNDFDADFDSIDQAILNTNVQHGTLNLQLDGSFTYTPAADFHGLDSFTYFAKDSANNEVSARPATVTIAIGALNHDPIANAATFTTNVNTTLNNVLSGSDVDGDTLTYSPGGVAPTHGSIFIRSNGTFTYTPATSFHGTDTFTFKVNDGVTDSAEALVNITINAVNTAPIANGADFTLNEDTSLSDSLSGFDAQSDPLQFFAGSVTAAHGTVVVNLNGTFNYVPAANFNGSDTFSYKVNDGQLNSVEAFVNVTVTPINDAPVTSGGNATVAANASLSNSLSPRGSDVDHDPLTYAVETPPAHGILNLSPDGTFTYTPAPNYAGPDFFTFKASDGHAESNLSQFNLSVVPANVPLTLDLSAGPTQVSRNRSNVPLDLSASVSDPDTLLSYSGTQIQASITAGGSPIDASKSRVVLALLSQGKGIGLVQVKGSKVLFDGSKTAIASVSGGKKGQPLIISFSSTATERAVNAVLKQIAVQATKKASPGNRTVKIQVHAGGQNAQATTTAAIV